MSVFTAVQRVRVVAIGVVCAGVVAAGPVALTSARAETSGQAGVQVQTLLKKVHALQAKAKKAEARYASAFGAVEDSVDTAVSADQNSGKIAAQAQTAQAQLLTHLQSLYESGGPLQADAAMLTSGSLNDLYDRDELVSHAMSAQVASVHAATFRAAQAAAEASAAARRSQHQIGTERDVRSAAIRVDSLLTEQKALLAKANKHLAAIKKAEAALAAQNAAFTTITTTSVAGLHILPPSAEYLALYKAAATTCNGLSWTVLAAIGQVESGHGRNPSTSSAGAMGPMQFEPATFAAYAVDGDHDGVKNIMDPADAIYTAAHYLCANGAGFGPHALTNAILHYNHAVWYVDMVETLAGEYATAYA